MPTTAVFTITLDAPSPGATVNYACVNGTAIAGTNYTATSGTLTFVGNAVSQTISIPVFPATTAATFYVVLSSPAGCTLSRATGTCTIGATVTSPTIISGPYASRFNIAYAMMKTNGFFTTTTRTSGGSTTTTTANPLGAPYITLWSEPSGVATQVASLGTTTYSYIVQAIDGSGNSLAVSPVVTTHLGPATIVRDSYVGVGWDAVAGAAGYRVYRTYGGTLGIVAPAAQYDSIQGKSTLTTVYFNDTGYVADSSPAIPTAGTATTTTTTTTGAAASTLVYEVPYHCVEALIVEAPDWGHESVSETISFWAKLEAWQAIINSSTTGYTAMWNSVEANFIPSATNQPTGGYLPAAPATYQPNQDSITQYPVLADTTVAVGADPLAAPLQATYSSPMIYLMHWMWDTDGVFGFKNGDGTTQQVAINSFQRGFSESVWLTITQCEWENWANGGGAYGYLPIFSQSTPTYPAAPFAYSKQWRYTCAPDAEGRLIAASYLVSQTQGSAVATQDAKAKKLGDYLRYALYDKYFKPVGQSSGHVYDGSGCHYLLSWYVSWGGDLPATGVAPAWGFRIGSSETHFGYNNVDAAYAMATSGGNYAPQTSGASAQWQISLSRQLEMIRWLQSPEGPIAGGVSNSWHDRYLTPTDGRQTATFYGMYYTYSPVFHAPPSNQWYGYQAWGLERVASLYLIVAAKTDTFSVNIRSNCGVILDHFVNWLLPNVVLNTDGTWTHPVNLYWTSPTAVSGQTTTAANNEGVYEYLPTLKWDSTGNYGAFWGASAVPNPNLHLSSFTPSCDIGSSASTAQLLIEYAKAKLNAGGALTDGIAGGSYHVQDALNLAQGLLDRMWSCKDTTSFSVPEVRADYTGYGQSVYLPPNFSGHMPNGDAMTPGTATFISMRSFMKSDPNWAQVQTYLSGGAAPTFHYHRFWHTTEIAAGFAMMAYYFPNVAPVWP